MKENEREAWEYSLRLLALPRTVHQMRAALRRRGYDRDTEEAVIARLCELGLLDDMAFARAYVRESLTLRPAGRHLLRNRLAARGIDRAEIAEVLATELSGEQEETAALRAAEGWLRRSASGDERQKRRRLQWFLQRRGFDWELAARVTRRLFSETED